MTHEDSGAGNILYLLNEIRKKDSGAGRRRTQCRIRLRTLQNKLIK